MRRKFDDLRWGLAPHGELIAGSVTSLVPTLRVARDVTLRTRYDRLCRWLGHSQSDVLEILMSTDVVRSCASRCWMVGVRRDATRELRLSGRRAFCDRARPALGETGTRGRARGKGRLRYRLRLIPGSWPNDPAPYMFVPLWILSIRCWIGVPFRTHHHQLGVPGTDCCPDRGRRFIRIGPKARTILFSGAHLRLRSSLSI